MSATRTTSHRARRSSEAEKTPSATAEPVVMSGGFTDSSRSFLWSLGVLTSAVFGSVAMVSVVGVLGVLLTTWATQGHQDHLLAMFLTLLTTVCAITFGASWWAAAGAWFIREYHSTTTISQDGISSTGFTGLNMSVPETLRIRGAPLLEVRLLADGRRIRTWRARTGAFDEDTVYAKRIASALGIPLIDERDEEVWHRFATDPTFRAVYTLRHRSVKNVKARPARHSVDHAGIDIQIQSAELFSSERRVRITDTHLIHGRQRIPLVDIASANVVGTKQGETRRSTLKIVVDDQIVPVFSIISSAWASRTGQMVWIAQQIEKAAANAKSPIGDAGDIPEALEALIDDRG